MANLTDGTNLTGTITLSKATGTKVTLDTDHKYLTKDIELTVNAPTATISTTGATVNYTSGWVNAGSTTVTDNNLVASNIKDGVSIFGVTGSLVSSGGVVYSDTLDESGGIIRTITTTEEPVMLKTKTVTANGTYNASGDDADGYSLITVNVNPRWETVHIDRRYYSNDWGNGNYYILITSWHELILANSVWRITWDGVQYECTATWADPEGDNYAIGNYTLDNGSGGTQYPFFMLTYSNGSELYIVTANSDYHSIIIEKLTNETVIWETIHTGIYPIYANENSGGYTITNCGPLQGFALNSMWRITWNGTQYICSASLLCTLMSSDYGIGYCIGNYSLADANISGNNEPFIMGVYDWHDGSSGITIGTSATSGTATIRIERMVGKLIPKTITSNGTYSAKDDNVDGYSSVIVNVTGGSISFSDVANSTGTTLSVSVSGSTNVIPTTTGTFTGDGTNVAEISCDFEPREIYISGDLTSDVSLRGIVNFRMIKDRFICATNDSSTSNTTENAWYIENITGYNESNSSTGPYASYSNGVLTINTVQNSSGARFPSGITYSYELIGTI